MRDEAREDEKARKAAIVRKQMSTPEGREFVSDILAMTVHRPVDEREPFTDPSIAQTYRGLEHVGRLLYAQLRETCADLIGAMESERNDRNARLRAQLDR